MSRPSLTSVTILETSVFGALLLLMVSFVMMYTTGKVIEREANVSSFFDISTFKDDYRYDETTGPVSVNVGQKVQKAIPLALPVKSIDEILGWSTQVAVQLFTLDFFKLDAQVDELRPYFTESGWNALILALKGSGWAASVIEKKLSVTSVVSGPPIILKHGILDGAYSWVINFPLLVTYEGASSKRTETRVFTITVRRINADYMSGQAGMAIDSFVTSADGGF